MNYDIGFLLHQNAGHLTNWRNLRNVVDNEAQSDIVPWWEELHYVHDGGLIENISARLPFLPPYLTCNTRMLLDFRRSIRRRHYDAVLTNSWATMFFPGAIARTPTILDFDSTSVQIDRMEAYDSPNDPAPLAALKRRLSQRAYGAARLLQAWSTWAKASAIADYGVPAEKIIVNPPGVDLDFFTPSTPRQAGSVRLLFVGGDFSRKGGYLLLEVLKHSTLRNLEVHIVTREPIAAGPGITVHHDISPNSVELLRLLHLSDIFVLPSLAECFGLATLEAMATGLPVIVSDVGGTADIVAPGENGYIVPAGDIAALSNALASLVLNPDLRRTMGSRSRQIAEDRFSARTNARRTLGYLREIAEEATTRRLVSNSPS